MGKFFKVAIRKEIKMIRDGKVTLKGIQRIVKNNKTMPHERFIKPLGEGSSTAADLVLHPTYGTSVRKSAVRPTKIPDLIQSQDFKIVEELHGLQKKNKSGLGFAKIHGVDKKTGLTFEQHIPAKDILRTRMKNKAKTTDLLKKRFRQAEKNYQDFRRSGSSNVAEHMKLTHEKNRVELLWHKHDARLGADINPTKRQLKTVKALSKKFPELHDYKAARNVVKSPTGKNIIIDISGAPKPPPGDFGLHPKHQFLKRTFTTNMKKLTNRAQ